MPGANATPKPAVSMALFILTYFGARGVLEMSGLAPPTRVAAVVLPIAVFAWWLFTIARGIRRSDELERRIQLEALAFAFPLSILLMFGLGLLELAVTLPPEDLSYRHVWVFLCIFYFAGLAIARRRYQ
jgi:hypothetical protein